ncbi:hypothetical protein QOL99_10800 [Deinococcus sp. MIMF12]|uniref:Uncharacterized protein n=1 Tax=Deinococcus rhizophilus TaxID=3049544 RepID=A0ABT7JHU8_9DEIO|nr:hypothetical protein [Deinococcus rhizophilus]MDL2344637.1 hypothetical protein [Deinococcus rhizophilus]
MNGVIRGYKVKSEKDTLKRLPAQVAAYSMVFDKMTLIVTENHHDATVQIIPNWWEVLIASTASSFLPSVTVVAS